MNNFDYYSFQIRNARNKICEEIDFYEKCEFHNINLVKDYLCYLKDRIGDKHAITSVTQYDYFGNKREIKKMNMDEYVKDIDIMMFNRAWNRLKEIHKFMKIKEFINGLKFGKKASKEAIEDNKKYLIDELYDGIKTKKFSKNKHEIVYDKEKMEITSISCLDFNKETGLYDIEW